MMLFYISPDTYFLHHINLTMESRLAYFLHFAIIVAFQDKTVIVYVAWLRPLLLQCKRKVYKVGLTDAMWPTSFHHQVNQLSTVQKKPFYYLKAFNFIVGSSVNLNEKLMIQHGCDTRIRFRGSGNVKIGGKFVRWEKCRSGSFLVGRVWKKVIKFPVDNSQNRKSSVTGLKF